MYRPRTVVKLTCEKNSLRNRVRVEYISLDLIDLNKVRTEVAIRLVQIRHIYSVHPAFQLLDAGEEGACAQLRSIYGNEGIYCSLVSPWLNETQRTLFLFVFCEPELQASQ